VYPSPRKAFTKVKDEGESRFSGADRQPQR
jgi:hypothetical protein